MLDHYVSSGPYSPPGASLRPTGALHTVGDDEGRIDKEVGAVASEPDRGDLDNVEHLRQSRLHRWQSPPLPTGFAKGR